jgi:hypothetical protein
MSPDQLTTLLTTLQPATLARMVVDLQELQQDWQHYPEEAPPAPVREALEQALAEIMKHGAARIEAGSSDFRQLVEQIKDERQAEDWSRDRDTQEQQNWLSDFD